MKRSRILGAGIALVVASLAAGPGTVPAAAQTAAETSSDPALQKAYDEAFAAMMADPQNLDKTFAYAEIAARKGDLEGAVGALERMLFINPDLPRVKLELGVLYFRLGSFETARAYLQEALAAPQVPAPVRERANGFLAEIDKRASQHQVSGSLYAGLRVQSNANAGPSGSTVMVGGFPFQLSSNFTKKGDFNLFGIGTLKYVYDFQDQNENTLEATATFYGARQQSQTSVNVTFLELTAGPRIPIPTGWLWQGAKINLRPYAIFDYVDLRDNPYYRSPGAGFETLAQIVPGTILQINLEGRDKRYQDSERLPLVRDQNGSELLARGQVIQRITDELAGILSGSIAKLNARGPAQAYRYYDYGLGLSYSFDAPFRLTEQPWNLTANATRAFYIYDQPDPNIDPDNTRFDRDWRFAVVGSVPVIDDWTVITTLGRTIRQSSIGNFAYNNNYASLGVSWRF